MRWLATAVLASSLAVPVAARADIELWTLQCTGLLPGGDVWAPGAVTESGVSITCTGPADSFTATGSVAVTNTPVGPGLLLTYGHMSFVDTTGKGWRLDFTDNRPVVEGVMPFAVATTPELGLDPDDVIYPTAAVDHEYRYHLREGEIRRYKDDCLVINPCAAFQDFRFTAEWLHDLPV